MAADTAARALETLQGLIGQLAAYPRFADRPLMAITRRVRRDIQLVSELERAAFAGSSPSETASFARLISLAGMINTGGRESLTDLAERSFTGELALEIAYDVVAGRRRPLAFALIDALGGG
jgi:hypothetical protein